MTTFCTLFGLLPLALGLGAGAELLGLTLVMRQLGHDAPQVSKSRAAAVFAVKVLGPSAGRGADELLVAARVGTGELLTPQAETLAADTVEPVDVPAADPAP